MMNLKEQIEKNTDVAWGTLHNRLKAEGLLSVVPKKRTALSLPTLRWVAAVAAIVVLTCVTFVFLLLPGETVREDVIVLYNQAGAPTLVTTLQDGSIVYLSDQATIEYPSHFNAEKRTVTLKGDAFFEISENKQQPFVIETPYAMVEVLGTVFNIKNRDDFSLSVKQGEVRVTSKKSGESVYVTAGQTALLRPDRLYTLPTDDYAQFHAYMDYIHFKDQALGDVVRFINENTDRVEMVIPSELAKRHITVTFHHNSPETMAMLICKALTLEYRQVENVIYISSTQ